MKKDSIKNSRLVGTFISRPIVDFVNLYLLAFDQKKSDLLRTLIKNWTEEKQKKYNEVVLINMIAKKEQEIWDFKKLKNIQFEDYLLSLTKKLADKGLSNGVISAIINKIQK